jgi:hypothetical protein
MAELFERRTKVISTSGAPIEEIQNAMKATTPFQLCFKKQASKGGKLARRSV